jgi:Ca2+-binding EF-hand superfamily protein
MCIWFVRGCLQAIAAIKSQSSLTEEQWQEVNKVFSALDKDRDGSLSVKVGLHGSCGY